MRAWPRHGVHLDGDKLQVRATEPQRQYVGTRCFICPSQVATVVNHLPADISLSLFPPNFVNSELEKVVPAPAPAAAAVVVSVVLVLAVAAKATSHGC